VVQLAVLLLAASPFLWLGMAEISWRSGYALPFTPYWGCGTHPPATLPEEVRIGMYEEFPTDSRLAKLAMVDFPVNVAVAAPSRAAFEELRLRIMASYPQVRDVYYWPVLTGEEGYYPGTWSRADAIARVGNEAHGVPVLWDLEFPPGGKVVPDIGNWWTNRTYLDEWFGGRAESVHVWRSHPQFGLDSWALRLVSMHYDPMDYDQLTLHLDLYAPHGGISGDHLARVMRCGVERYGSRFVPSLGVLNDGEGPEWYFIDGELLRRNLRLARHAGVSEVWLFGLNGVTPELVHELRSTFPLEGDAFADTGSG
jgi:hypothetical protein